MEYLIVDGYNIINAWSDIFNLRKEPLEDCRDKLVRMLSNFQGYRKIEIIVVFDAHLVKGSQEKQEMYDNVLVVFTKEHETADNYIERFVYKFGTLHRIRVATLDYLEQRMILNRGGERLSPRELREEMEQAGKNAKTGVENVGKKGNTIMSSIDPELLDKLEKMRRGKF